MIPKSGNRFPACAQPWHGPLAWIEASAGEGRSEKIMHGQHRQSGENAMLGKIGGAAFAAAVAMTSLAQARDYEVTVRNDIVFAEHDGVKLLGDLYAPKGLDKAPVLVGVHGGGWQVGGRKFYRNWGTYLAKNGYAVFAIE